MGKLEHETHTQHISHPHVLELCNLQTETQYVTTLCSGCKLPISGYVYTCRPCNFTLHVACTQFPPLITHPSHPNHHLSLLPLSNYPGGVFNCDACNRSGNGFSYHCKQCDYDLHVTCASKPLSVNNQFHPNHPLQLTFHPPYEAKGFSCDICRKIGAKQWLYRCVGCEFDVHLDCASSVPRQATLQHHHSLPVSQPQQLNHYNSFQGVAATGTPVGQPNYYAHSASSGGRLQNNTSVGGGNGIMSAMMQGLVEGAAQQVGQTMMQSLIGGGDAGASGGDAGAGGEFCVDGGGGEAAY